jgi:LmbE family N-acetylglucosaminyl deacetylase
VATSWGPAIYFVPHQDDETLTMGADIAAHYRAGREIIVVQVTDGAESGVRAEMCAQKGICLTVAEIVAARNSEQLAAMQHLAPTARIEYANLPDASLTVATASALIAKYVARYPTASFKTMSWLDDHPDHRALAYALRDMCSRIPSHDCRYEQFRRYWVSKPIAGYFVPGSTDVLAAMDEYFVWNPDGGRYAIGTAPRRRAQRLAPGQS